MVIFLAIRQLQDAGIKAQASVAVSELAAHPGGIQV
jgi:hypothetical protein